MVRMPKDASLQIRRFVRSPQGGLSFTFLILLFFGYLKDFSFTLGWFMGFLVTFYLFFVIVLYFQKFGLRKGSEILITGILRVVVFGIGFLSFLLSPLLHLLDKPIRISIVINRS